MSENHTASFDHPENYLHEVADDPNRRRPAPRNLDELLAEPDPLTELAENKKSTKQAILYTTVVPLVFLIVALGSRWLLHSLGGPICTADPGATFCTRNQEVWWPIITSFIAFLVVVGCSAIMITKLNHYKRWRPWMGSFWVLVPLAMMWWVYALPTAILGHGSPWN